MLRAMLPNGEMKPIDIGAADCVLPAGAVWIDMFNPTRAEEQFIEAATAIMVPTLEEMEEIETSSRLYSENDAIYMTATIATGIMKENAESHSVSFVLTPAHLITVRYAETASFERFAGHAERAPELCGTPALALVNLLDAIIDRLADSIEHIGREVDSISRQAFRRARASGQQQRVSNIALQALLVRIGSQQDALAKARDSTVSLSRAVGYLAFAAPKSADIGGRVKSLMRDLASISDHAGFMATNITFLLDAALGFISIEQNAIFKILSVASLVFLPPTLVAGIYGMNFDVMPELHWVLGYPFAISMMVLSAVGPYLFIRWRGWL